MKTFLLFFALITSSFITAIAQDNNSSQISHPKQILTPYGVYTKYTYPDGKIVYFNKETTPLLPDGAPEPQELYNPNQGVTIQGEYQTAGFYFGPSSQQTTIPTDVVAGVDGDVLTVTAYKGYVVYVPPAEINNTEVLEQAYNQGAATPYTPET